MKGKIKNQIAFYAENSEGLFDRLIIDIAEKIYEYDGNLDKRELWHGKNNCVKKVLVEKKALDAIYDLVECNYSGSVYFEEKSYEIRQKEKKLWKQQQLAKNLVPKEKLWQAIRWELDDRELQDLINYDKYRYEKDDYYDFQLIIEKIHEVMAGKKPVRYFTTWCILLMRCLYEAMSNRSMKLKEAYDEIAYWLDGTAFMSSNISEKKKGIECRELIAYLKYFNHQISDIKNGETTPFMKNGVVTCVTSAYCVNNYKDDLSRVCVADHERKTVNYLFVCNLDFNEEINYTLLTEAEFEEQIYNYFEYQLDTTMTEDYQLLKVEKAND